MSLLTQQPPTQSIPSTDADADADAEANRHPAHHSGRYIGYVLYFVGAGLISGAVVHHPLDPPRYTTIALAGVAVFLTATVVNEFLLVTHRPHLTRMALIVVASLFLSFGIGMLSGGLQHFEDFPDRGAVLVPAGIVVSYIAFVAKDPHTATHRIFGRTGLLVATLAVAAYFGLSTLAHNMSASDGHGHAPSTPVTETPAEDKGGQIEEPSEHTERNDNPAPAPDGTHESHNDGELDTTQ